MEPAPAPETSRTPKGPAAAGPEPVEGQALSHVVPSASARDRTPPLDPSPQTPDPIRQTPSRPPRKIRSDAKLEQLSPARRERLRVWLEDENRPYADVVARLRAEFGLTVGKSAVALYWRRHLLPQQPEAEIAADFDAATLNQARALAWTALARPPPNPATHYFSPTPPLDFRAIPASSGFFPSLPARYPWLTHLRAIRA